MWRRQLRAQSLPGFFLFHKKSEPRFLRFPILRTCFLRAAGTAVLLAAVVYNRGGLVNFFTRYLFFLVNLYYHGGGDRPRRVKLGSVVTKTDVQGKLSEMSG